MENRRLSYQDLKQPKVVFDYIYFLFTTPQFWETPLIVTASAKEKEKAVPKNRSRKQLREGEFDWDAITPWKLDFNDPEKKFWEWEQKWRTFCNFSGLLSAKFVTSSLL